MRHGYSGGDYVRAAVSRLRDGKPVHPGDLARLMEQGYASAESDA